MAASAPSHRPVPTPDYSPSRHGLQLHTGDVYCLDADSEVYRCSHDGADLTALELEDVRLLLLGHAVQGWQLVTPLADALVASMGGPVGQADAERCDARKRFDCGERVHRPYCPARETAAHHQVSA